MTALTSLSQDFEYDYEEARHFWTLNDFAAIFAANPSLVVSDLQEYYPETYNRLKQLMQEKDTKQVPKLFQSYENNHSR
jgi:hypothetical protein